MDSEMPEENASAKKRPLENESVEEEPKTKKPKVFSIKQFRKQLHSAEKHQALREYLSVLSTPSKHDYLLDYLKNGGNCLELLQTLESDSAISPALVFDLVTQLLLGITVKYVDYYSSAYESCRYLINNYLPVVHKMLGLSSSKEERKVCLKLLTAMTALSSNLAKDILINVKFHSANIALLTKHTGEKNSVRDSFVHFLTAFLVDADTHTLSVLLEKSSLLTSIISGLQYDDPDTVCVVVAAMKNHILENPSIMKTTKMHVFNTAVVKDIVNLYNWKGPEGLKALDKNNKNIIEIDKLAKSKVSECIHDFLLILCTSHKLGVIFRDHLVGLGRKNLNSLMYTVLDSLDRPWEHSYASELVLKICKSCPDLTKNMWLIVKPFLEPRLTEKWLNTMEFSAKLIEEMEPMCIEYCAKDLTPQQLAQIIEMLVSPVPILKTLLTDNHDKDVKIHILKLLHRMLEKINLFLSASRKWTNNHLKITQHLSNYISKHYPNAYSLLQECKNEQEEYLETVLDILNIYKNVAPQLLYNVAALDFKDFLEKLSENSEEVEKVEHLQIKIISIFVDIDQASFLPETEIFAYIVPILLKVYHKEHDNKFKLILWKLLKNTSIFDNNIHEINIWLNGIFNFNSFSNNFAKDFVEIVKDTAENLLEYQKEILQTTEGDDDETVENNEIIENLIKLSNNEETVNIKNRNCSAMIQGFFTYINKSQHSKNLKKYLEHVLINLFHNQTNLPKFASIIQKHKELIPSNICKYINSWLANQPIHISKIKGVLSIFKDISDNFLNASLKPDNLHGTFYPDFLLDVTRLASFYFTNSPSENNVKNLLFLIQYIIDNNFDTIDDGFLQLILAQPILVKSFNVLSKNIITKPILDMAIALQKSNINLDNYLQYYSSKLYQNICKLLKNPKKYSTENNILECLQVFPLNYKQSLKIIDQISVDTDTENPAILNLLTYSIDRILVLCKNQPHLEPINEKLILKITTVLINFNNENKDASSLSRALRHYFEIFPHNSTNINKNLFSSLLTLSEYNKDHVDLVIFLLQNDLDLLEHIEANISSICDKKGLILPIVHVLVNNNTSNKILENIYSNLESSIIKAIRKPQKVGQHFAKNYDVTTLIEKFMPLDKCISFAEKVQKFEVAEVFHARLLEACYSKIINSDSSNDKHLNNIIMTFVHLEIAVFKRKLEKEEDIHKANEITNVFSNVLSKIGPRTLEFTVNDSFCKIALKFGVSGQSVLLNVLNKLIKIYNVSEDEAGLLLDMLLSHSEFLNVMLGEHSVTKLEVLQLILSVCEKCPKFMVKSHIAVLLSAYRGMLTKCDQVILALLKLYESKPDQTGFYDFKPFLWGRAAAAHYSVRTQIGNSLTRQPKISDVLGILKEDLVNCTITNYPLNNGLHDLQLTEDLRCYDLKFLLPLFSHILAPEQQVKTYVFTRCGALSLSVLSLACQDKEVRQAACHVLARLHFHLEARQTGKDNLLWIRFVEALCKGVAVLPNFKLNSFSAIFFARMALILTNPKHLMYSPLSSYLMAKQELDLSTVPELYTLLFSPDINYKEHQNFILEILRDGMKCEKDFLDFLKSMGFKLFSELFNSCLSDLDSKLLILDVLEAICKIPLGVKILIEKYSLLSQLSNMGTKMPNIFNILLNIVKIRTDKYTGQIIFDISQSVFDSDNLLNLKDKELESFYEIFYIVFTNNPSIIERNRGDFINKITLTTQDRFCNYLVKYGVNRISEKCAELQEKHKLHYLRLLIFNMLK
ncbi:unnamed protein product [Ceutorhynchus assimilis]|uniref:Nucleolar pre-ribosomal-associated protein 1 n=1 Tax=Ceutorhynchus assimilis TaxID=467358 RepID=A0A9P0GPR8_9CUCU|nr:unnamed protein product [Ceutorhynchus assimilis]